MVTSHGMEKHTRTQYDKVDWLYSQIVGDAGTASKLSEFQLFLVKRGYNEQFIWKSENLCIFNGYTPRNERKYKNPILEHDMLFFLKIKKSSVLDERGHRWYFFRYFIVWF